MVHISCYGAQKLAMMSTFHGLYMICACLPCSLYDPLPQLVTLYLIHDGDLATLCVCDVCTLLYTGESMQWTVVSGKGSPPLPRSLHSAVLLKNKMFVFGGWVPLLGDDGGPPVHETEWKCSNSLACLNTG